jgi:uncharacterized SAM-binding protein YcdF (DUF218 family)
MPLSLPGIKNKWSYSIIVILIVLIDLLSLYFLKYKGQGLSIKEFNLFYTGNLLNLITSLLLIVSIVFYTKSSKIVYRPTLLIIFALLMTFMLAFSEIYKSVGFPSPNFYIFDHPLKDVLKGFFFSVYQFLEFLFISILWVTLFGRKELLILRAFVNSVLMVIFLLVFEFFYLLSNKENYFRFNADKQENYVGVVLGAAVWTNNQPSPSLASRAEKAAELYKLGVLSKIQLTGGHAPGELSEAEVAYHYLKNKNIDTSHIWIEKKTSSTIEQVRFIKRNIIKARNIHNILVISDAYHLMRVKQICDFYNMKVKIAASDRRYSFDSQLYHKIRESIALLVFWFFAI